MISTQEYVYYCRKRTYPLLRNNKATKTLMSTEKRLIKQIMYIHTMEYYVAIKNEGMLYIVMYKIEYFKINLKSKLQNIIIYFA